MNFIGAMHSLTVCVLFYKYYTVIFGVSRGAYSINVPTPSARKLTAVHVALGALTQLVWARGRSCYSNEPIASLNDGISSRPSIRASKVYVSFNLGANLRI